MGEEEERQYEEICRAVQGFTSEFLFRKEGTVLVLMALFQWEGEDIHPQELLVPVSIQFAA